MYDQHLSKLWMNEQERCEVAKNNFEDMTNGMHHTRYFF